AATGHTEGEAVKENEVAATCTEDGSYDSVVYCTECGEELSRETVTVSATGHSYESDVTEPTCTTGGYTTHTCKVCGDSYIDSETEALGHSWDDGTVTTEATCTTDGVKTYTCTVCGETKTEAIAATGHSLMHVEAKEATCTEAGNMEYWYCETCGTYFGDAEGTMEISQADTVISATVHTSGEAVKENEAAATCTEAGSCDSVVYCTECGEELSRETVTIPATGHSYESVVTEPTCTESGYTTHTCTVCGDSYIDSENEATGHSWDEGVVTTEATETSDGVRTYTCTACGETRTEVIEATGSTETGESEVTESTATETSADSETESTATATSADTETTATENTSGTDTSLRTGDDSKWLLWTILLFLSSVGLISLEAYGKKKRSVG
ncbi:MAG: hypothetical protein LUE29_02100, partial [Lachnospiraceae bacterium]|nr:hypothetical protein [Lachnospiraceae bacterium]